MSFLYPAFLIGAIAIAIPIVLHLLRRDVAPEVPFTAVRLLRRTPLEQTRRRSLRDLLLLIARVAALVLLAVAFARPYLPGAASSSSLLIVAIDRSFSMGAPKRFEHAQQLARDAIDSAGRRDRVAVVAFDDRADVLAPPGTPAAARAALEGLRPGYGGTRYAPLVSRAIELAELGPARLVVVTDMQRAGWENEDPISIPSTLQIDVRDTGPVASNAALVAVRREPASVVATIRNTGAAPISGQARVLSDGRQAASAPFAIPAASAADVPIAYRIPGRGAVTVEIDDADGLPADNRRYVILDPAGRRRVLVIAADAEQSGFYVTRALQAASGDEAFDVRVRLAPSLGSMPAPELAQTAAVVLLSTRSLDRRARDSLVSFVRNGGGLMLAAAPDVDPTAIAAIMEWPGFAATEHDVDTVALAATDLRHPIFGAFGPLAANLGQVHFSRAWRVRGQGWDVAARFTDGTPALLERREGQGRVMLFASDVDRRWNDFPLNPSFVPFALETVRYMVSAVSAPERRREYLVGQAPPGIRPEPGTYTMQDDGRVIAVNVDARESTIVRMPPDEFRAMLKPVDTAQTAGHQGDPRTKVERRAEQIEGRQNLWRYGLLIMLAALVAESFVGRVRA